MQIQIRIAGTGAGPCDAQDSCAISWPFRVPLRGLGVIERLVRSALSYAIQGVRRGSRILRTRLRKRPKQCVGRWKPLWRPSPGTVATNGETMKYLFILNDSPYGTQRTYNALRLVRALATGNREVAIFLLGDGVVSGLRRQSPADASYNVQEMLRTLVGQRVPIAACRTCLEARGIDDQSLVEGVQRRTLDDLRDWTEEAEKVLIF